MVYFHPTFTHLHHFSEWRVKEGEGKVKVKGLTFTHETKWFICINWEKVKGEGKGAFPMSITMNIYVHTYGHFARVRKKKCWYT